MTFAGIASISVGYLFLSSAGPGGPKFDMVLFLFIAITAFPYLLYMNLVRGQLGTNLGGAILISASVLPFLALEVDDGLEILNIPVLTFVAGLIAVGIDSAEGRRQRQDGGPEP